MNRIIVFLLIFFQFSYYFSQFENDLIVYFNSNYEVVLSKDSAWILRTIKYNYESKKYDFSDFYLNRSHGFIQKGEFKSLIPEIKDGNFIMHDALGNVITVVYSENKFVDVVESKNSENKIVENIYFGDLIDSVPLFQNLSVNSTDFVKLLRTLLEDSIDINFADSKNIFCQIGFIVENCGEISNLKVYIDDQNASAKIKNAINELKFRPAIYKDKKVRYSVLIAFRFSTK